MPGRIRKIFVAVNRRFYPLFDHHKYMTSWFWAEQQPKGDQHEYLITATGVKKIEWFLSPTRCQLQQPSNWRSGALGNGKELKVKAMEFSWIAIQENSIAIQENFILRRLKNKVPQSKLIIIAEAIFTSVARYGIAVYYKPRLHSDPTCEEQTKLQVIQNKMLRLLAGKRPADKVRIEDLSRKFNMMSMNQMASYHVLMETYNAINLGSSEKIRDKLLPSTTSRYLTVPLFKKSSCRSFSYFASRLWNRDGTVPVFKTG